MRILLPDLQPNEGYGIRFRLVGHGRQSDWSNITRFTTDTDSLAPANVTGLQLKAIGTAFEVTWDRVTTNTDGTPLKDFKDYQVVVTAGGMERVWYVTQERFDLPIEVNTNAFGTPRGSISVAVSARDTMNNIAPNPATKSAQNAFPAAPTGLVARPVVNGVNLNWNKVPDDDVKFYRVYRGTNINYIDTVIYEGPGNGYLWETVDFSTDNYFRVVAVDVFNQEGPDDGSKPSAAPLAYDSTDRTPPAPPTWPAQWFSSEMDLGNKYVALANVILTWNPNTESDLASYVVRYKKSADSVWSETRVHGTDLTAPANTVKINGLAGNTAYNFQVAAVDKTGNTSGFTPAPGNGTTTRDTTAPSAPSKPIVTNYKGGILQVAWDGKNSTGGAMENDLAHIQVHVSKTSGFTPTVTTLTSVFPASAGANKTLLADLDYDTTYYIKFIAQDFAGNNSNASAQESGVPKKITGTAIEEGAIVTEHMVADTIDGDRIRAQTLSAAKIKTGELAADARIIAGPELGTHAEMSGTGFRVYAASDDGVNPPNEVIRLGTDTNDYFAVTKSDGSYAATIDDTGRASMYDLNVQNNPEFRSEPLWTKHPTQEEINAAVAAGQPVPKPRIGIIDRLPRGIVANGWYPMRQDNLFAEYGEFEVAFDAEAGRSYMISVYGLQWGHAVPGSNATFMLRAITPTSNGAAVELTRRYKQPGNSANFRRPDEEIHYMHQALVGGTHRIILSAYSDTGGLHPYGDAFMIIEDIGISKPNTAIPNTLGGTPNNPPPQPPKQTYTKQYVSTWSMAYKGDGTQMSNWGGRLYQGRDPSGSNGNQKSLVGWNAATVMADLAGAEINQVLFHLHAAHWYYNSGGTAVIGAHALSSTPGTFSGTIDPGRMHSTGWPKPGGRWVDITSWGNEIKGGSVRGLVLGPGPDTNLVYYGYFHGHTFSDGHPTLQVTFTK